MSKITYKTNSQRAEELLRNQRDQLLDTVVDNKAKIYLNQNLPVPQILIDYRQALCDLPANSTPTLDENGNLTGVEWPTKPE